MLTISCVSSKIKEYYSASPASVLFILISLLFAISILILGIFSQGKYFFFAFNCHPANDPFTDFTRSVMWSVDDPYNKWSVIYPPLITAFYALIGHVTIPYQGQGADVAEQLFNSYLGMMAFLLTTIAAIWFTYVMIQKMFKDNNTTTQINILFLFILFSFPVIYAFERGNCIFYAIAFMLQFIVGYKSDNKTIRILSYVCIALAISIKIVPGLLLFLLIRERNWKGFGTCMLLSAVLLTVPFIFTGGDPITWLSSMFSYSGSITTGDTIIHQFEWLEEHFGWPVGFLGLPITVLVLLLSILLVCLDRKLSEWQAVQLLCANMIIGFGVNTLYSYLYFLPALLLFLKHTKILDKKSALLTLLFSIVFILMPWYECGHVRALAIFMITMIIFGDSLKRLFIKFKTKNQHIDGYGSSEYEPI